jgi:hypothetical protein
MCNVGLDRVSPNRRRLLNQELNKNEADNDGVGWDRQGSHARNRPSKCIPLILVASLPYLGGFVNGQFELFGKCLGFAAESAETLYMDSCGIVLTNLSGLTGRQVVRLILLSMPLGGLLWLYGRTPLRCRGYVGLTIGGLLWLVIVWILGGFSLIPSI